MKLGSYTLPVPPDRFPPPRAGKIAAAVQTYASIAYYSWGTTILGKIITLEWDNLGQMQFDYMDTLFKADASLTWDPDCVEITHGTVTNGPFEEERTLTGQTSGATGYSASIDATNKIAKLASVVGTFSVGENLRDVRKFPIPVAEITAISHPTYTVEIVGLDCGYLDLIGPRAGYRNKVRMSLLIMAVL